MHTQESNPGTLLNIPLFGQHGVFMWRSGNHYSGRPVPACMHAASLEDNLPAPLNSGSLAPVPPCLQARGVRNLQLACQVASCLAERKLTGGCCNVGCWVLVSLGGGCCMDYCGTYRLHPDTKLTRSSSLACCLEQNWQAVIGLPFLTTMSLSG